jgi:hypothetical protein
MSKKSTSGVAAAVLLGLMMSAFSAPPAFAAAKHHRSVHAWTNAAPYKAAPYYFASYYVYYVAPSHGWNPYPPSAGGTTHRG